MDKQLQSKFEKLFDLLDAAVTIVSQIEEWISVDHESKKESR